MIAEHERFKTANSELGLGLLSSASGLVGTRVLGEPVLEVKKLAVATVVHTSLVVLGIELEGRISADVNTVDLVSRSIELGDNKVINVGNFLGKLVPDGGEGLAVAAPGSVVLNKHILAGILDDVFPVLTNEGGETVDWVRLRDRLGLEMGLEVTCLVVRDELGDRVAVKGLDVAFVIVLEHGLLRRDDTELRKVALLNTDELTKTRLDALRDARGHEQDLALEVGGSLGEGSLVVGALLLGEKDDGRVVVTEDRLNEIFAEGNKTRNRRLLGKLNNFLLSGGSNGERRLVKLTGEGDAWGSSNTEVTSARGVTGVEEGELLADGGVLGTLHEGLKEVTGELTEVAQGKLGLASLGLHIFARDLEGGRACLLVDPLDDGVLGAATGVVHLSALVPEEERWEALDLHALGKLFVLCRVDLGNRAGWILSSQHLGGTLVLRSELLAVAARRHKETHVSQSAQQQPHSSDRENSTKIWRELVAQF